MKIFKYMVKALLRRTLQWRLNLLPASAAQADFWIERIRCYPAIFNGIDLHRRRVRLPNGLQMELGLLDLIERQLRTRGEWEPSVGQAIADLLQPGDTFLDIGANIGYFSLLAAKIVGPQGRVFAFEPAFITLTQLVKHIEMNGCDNIIVNALALGDTTTTATLNIAHAHNRGQTSLQPTTVSRQQQPTLVMPLDALLPAATKIALIKIDIEGGEVAALHGMQQLLQRQKPAIICELIDPFSAHCQAVQTLLLEQGYRLYDLQTRRAFTPQPGMSNIDVLCQHPHTDL